MKRIRISQMNRGIRFAGGIMRTFIPYFKPSTFRIANRAMRLIPRRMPRDLHAREVFVPRDMEDPLRLLVCSPDQTGEQRPGILWIHGGGYGLGVPEQDLGFIRLFVKAAGCAVVAPDYTLSVQKPYPAALDDCMLALMWLKNNAQKIGVRSDQLFVGGDSAGGGLCAALTIRARDEESVRIAYQMPLYPMIDDRMTTPSSQDNDAPNWNTKSNENGWRLYLADLFGTDKVPVYAAPARLRDFHGLPPACTYVGSLDPFLDETRQYVENLRSAGVPVSFRIFDGCFHGFDIVAPQSQVAKQARVLLLQCVKDAARECFAPQDSLHRRIL